MKCLKKSCRVVPSRHLPAAVTGHADDNQYESPGEENEFLDDSNTSDSSMDDSNTSDSSSGWESVSSDETDASPFDNDPISFLDGQKNCHANEEPECSLQDAVNEVEKRLSNDDIPTDHSQVLHELHEFVINSDRQTDFPSTGTRTTSDSGCQTEDLEASPKPTVLSLLKTDEDISMFTGVSFAMLNCLTILVGKFFGDSVKCQAPLKIRIALTLCKLRLNLSFGCIGVLFGVNRRLCGSYFGSTISMLANILRCAIYWPSKEENAKNMPKCFKKFRDTRVVLDCTEVPADSPDCLHCRIRMFSHYKGRLTIKFLVGVTPSGLISFLSRVYGGRASDKKIFEESELITILEPFLDAIMVDKGFRIDKVCEAHNFKIHRPPFVVKRQQLVRAMAILNAEIASARVHVERVIQRMKIFKILQEKVSWATIPYINDIITVIAGLVNLSSPIFSAEKFLTESSS